MHFAGGVPRHAAEWASVPATTRTEVAQRLALAGALRSMDEIIRLVAQHGSAEDMRDVREGTSGGLHRGSLSQCVFACVLSDCIDANQVICHAEDSH